jgi:hypothetical protein
MLVIGDVPSDISDGSSSRPSKRRRIEPTQGISIPLDDDFGPLEFLFKLLDGFVGRLHDHAAYSIMGIKLLADEYELALATRLLGEQLWQEVVEGTYGTTRAYAIAMRMQWKALARFALSRMDSDRRPPVKWSLETAQIVGLDAWHCAINAASDCKPFDWEEVAERLEFPPSWVTALVRAGIQNRWMLFAGGPSSLRETRNVALSVPAPGLLPCKPIFIALKPAVFHVLNIAWNKIRLSPLMSPYYAHAHTAKGTDAFPCVLHASTSMTCAILLSTMTLLNTNAETTIGSFTDDCYLALSVSWAGVVAVSTIVAL